MNTMNTIREDTLPCLYDHADDRSGVRRIPRDEVAILVDETDEAPRCIYAVADSGRCKAPRRYYLGVRFVEGVIADADWEARMRADGVSLGAIEQTWRWLHDRAL